MSDSPPDSGGGYQVLGRLVCGSKLPRRKRRVGNLCVMSLFLFVFIRTFSEDGFFLPFGPSLCRKDAGTDPSLRRVVGYCDHRQPSFPGRCFFVVLFGLPSGMVLLFRLRRCLPSNRGFAFRDNVELCSLFSPLPTFRLPPLLSLLRLLFVLNFMVDLGFFPLPSRSLRRLTLVYRFPDLPFSHSLDAS